MSVERRYGARRPVDLEVQVRYRQRHFSVAKGRNLSVEGMYLSVPRVTLHEGTMVELELEAAGKRWLIDGIVVHRHEAGVGVMFREHQPDLFRALCQTTESLVPRRTVAPQRQAAARR
jgi:hypothetical protein